MHFGTLTKQKQKNKNLPSVFLRWKEQNFTEVKLEIPLWQNEPLHSKYNILKYLIAWAYIEIGFKSGCFMLDQVNNNDNV